MHNLEPHYNWRHLYVASDDQLSPFFGRDYNEFEFKHAIYDHWIHPQWDFIGSSTLFMKLIYANYEKGFCVIELMGEWNDTLHNDIMYLKRDIADVLIDSGITRFILIGENIMNFHAGDDDYYQEWSEDIENGWIIGLNFREHVVKEFENANLDYYIAFGGRFNTFKWRALDPVQLHDALEDLLMKRLNP